MENWEAQPSREGGTETIPVPTLLEDARLSSIQEVPLLELVEAPELGSYPGLSCDPVTPGHNHTLCIHSIYTD